MFFKPTINDALDRLRPRLDRAVDAARQSVKKIKAEHSAKGLYRSGATIKRVLAETQSAFDGAVQETLDDLARIVRKTDLDAQTLRQLTGQLLAGFVLSMKSVAEPDVLKGIGQSAGTESYINEQLEQLDRKLLLALKQFDVGLHATGEPEIPRMAGNSINIGTMTGSTIQQGSPGSTQSVEFRLDIRSATAAAERFEAALAQQQLDNATMSTIAADLATIKAQLSKPSPSFTILQEAGRSIRNVVEGIAAGILTNDFFPTAAALGAALGLR